MANLEARPFLPNFEFGLLDNLTKRPLAIKVVLPLCLYHTRKVTLDRPALPAEPQLGIRDGCQGQRG